MTVLIKSVFLSKEIKYQVISLCDYGIKSQRYNKSTNAALIDLRDRLLSKANVINSYEKDLINLIYRIKKTKDINSTFKRVQKIKKQVNVRLKKQGKLNSINTILSKYIAIFLLSILSVIK